MTSAERREMGQYRYVFRMGGRRVSRKAMDERFGRELVERRMLEAGRYFCEECGADDTSAWMDGMSIQVAWR